MDESHLEENKREYTPEEAALLIRHKVLFNMRWAVILGIVVALLLAFQVFRNRFPLVSVFIVGFLMAVHNKKPAKRVSLHKSA